MVGGCGFGLVGRALAWLVDLRSTLCSSRRLTSRITPIVLAFFPLEQIGQYPNISVSVVFERRSHPL